MAAADMEVVIDGQTRKLPMEMGLPFEQVMQEVKKTMVDPGISITRVKLNGEDITGSSWERFADTTVEKIKILELETGDVKKLAVETLDSLREFTDSLVDELKRAAEQFRLGNEMEGGDVFSRALDGIQLVNHTTAMVERNLEIESRYSQGNGDSMSHQFGNMEAIIEDMFASQTDRDWVLLADLIEYELIPHFAKRQKILGMWKELTVG